MRAVAEGATNEPTEPTPPPRQVSVQGTAVQPRSCMLRGPAGQAVRLPVTSTQPHLTLNEVNLKLAYKRLLRSEGETRESLQTLPISSVYLPLLPSFSPNVSQFNGVSRGQ